MNTPVRLILAIIVAVIVGCGFMFYDKSRGAEWVVSPQQIEQAKAEGKSGVESRPGTVTVLPIRSETADALPFKWAMYGVVAGLFVLVATRRRKKPDHSSEICSGSLVASSTGLSFPIYSVAGHRAKGYFAAVMERASDGMAETIFPAYRQAARQTTSCTRSKRLSWKAFCAEATGFQASANWRASSTFPARYCATLSRDLRQRNC